MGVVGVVAVVVVVVAISLLRASSSSGVSAQGFCKDSAKIFEESIHRGLRDAGFLNQEAKRFGHC